MPPAVLREAVGRHATFRRAAYGIDINRNAMKAHMTLHLADMFEAAGALYSCWVQERHHRLLTRYAGPSKNTASYELGVMQNITVEQCQALEREWLRRGFVEPYHPKRRVGKILDEFGFSIDGLGIASSCKCCFGSTHIADVVGVSDGGGGALEVGEVVMLLKLNGSQEISAIICMGELDSATATFGHTWRMRAARLGMSLRETKDIQVAFVYSRDSPTSDVAIVIVPPKWR